MGRCPETVLGSVPLCLTRRPSLKELERDARGQKKKQEQKTDRTGPGKRAHQKRNRRSQPGQGENRTPGTKHIPFRECRFLGRCPLFVARLSGRRPLLGSRVGARLLSPRLATRPYWSKAYLLSANMATRPTWSKAFLS